MNKLIAFCSLILISSAFSAQAESTVWIKCGKDDRDVRIYIGDKYVGDCPIRVSLPEGDVLVRARKTVDETHAQYFKKDIVVVNGKPQSVDVFLSEPQISKLSESRYEYAKPKSTYKEGDVVAKYKLEEIEQRIQAEFRRAEEGNTEDMKRIARYYDVGIDVEPDQEKAYFWLKRANEETLRQSRPAKRGNIDFFAYSSMPFRTLKEARHAQQSQHEGSINGTISYTSAATEFTALPILTVFDIAVAPFNSTEMYKSRSAASLHPSTWGQPDSMIAKASRIYMPVTSRGQGTDN